MVVKDEELFMWLEFKVGFIMEGYHVLHQPAGSHHRDEEAEVMGWPTARQGVSGVRGNWLAHVKHAAGKKAVVNK